MTHICVSKLTIIGSDNGLPPDRRQAIIWTDAGILLIRTLTTNFSEILGEMHSFSFKKMHLKMSSAKERLFGLGLNELRLANIPTWPRGNVHLCMNTINNAISLIVVVLLPDIYIYIYIYRKHSILNSALHQVIYYSRRPILPEPRHY